MLSKDFISMINEKILFRYIDAISSYIYSEVFLKYFMQRNQEEHIFPSLEIMKNKNR